MKTKLLLVATLLCITLSYAQKTHVPDNNFEQALIDLGVDDVLDDYVLTGNIKNVTDLDLKDTEDFMGIEDFVGLINLKIKKENGSKNLDLSKIIFLEKLEIDLTKSSLSSSIIENNLALKEFKITLSDASLGFINFENNLVLEKLIIRNSLSAPIGFLNLSNHTKLQEVSIDRVEGLNLSNCTALESLRAGELNNGINLSNCTALKKLDFTSKGSVFSSLDLSSCTALESLYIEKNINLKNLNLSNNINLDYLYLKYLNKLESLNLKNGNNTIINDITLKVLLVLTCITVDDATYSTTNWTFIDSHTAFSEDCNAAVELTYIPDNNFEQALIDLGVDDVLDDYVPTANINTITNLDVSNKAITDLTGIENFIALKELYCSNNQLTQLDLSKNIALSRLFFGKNQFTNIDLSKNTALTYISCRENQLSSLDVSKNTILTELYCSNNQLKHLDISKNTVLKELSCYDNQLTQLDVSKNTGLQDFYCQENQLSNLDVSKNTTLINFNCSNNQLTQLDVSNSVALWSLKCFHNQLTHLDISKNTALERLSCSENQLTNLDLSNIAGLQYLYCYDNRITDLNVSKNLALVWLNCSGNLLTTLDLNKNVFLKELSCYDNQLTYLDVSNNPGLIKQDYSYNQLVSLNIKNGNNKIITDFKAVGNPNLTCVTVDDATYSTANWTNIDSHTTFSEDCNAAVELTYIPDNNFEQALIDLGYDDILDDYVATASINALTNLDVSNKAITDLTGIEDFIELTTLNCNNNLLTTLDTRHNTELVTFTSDNNELTYLDVCENHKVTYFSANNNAFTGLNVKNGNNTNFTYFSALNNPDLVCITVDNVGFSTTNWTNIDTQSNFNKNCTVSTPDSNFEQALIDLGIDDTVDGKVTLTNAISLLKNLDVSDKNIIDLTGIEEFASLEKLNVSDNKIVDLDLSANLQLLEIITENNNLYSLDVKNGNNSSVTLFNATRNPNLTCVNVDNAVYSTENWTTIDVQTSFSDDCRGEVLANNEFDLKGFVMYPNPVKNKLQISIEEEANYTLVNINGQIIFTGKLIFGKNLINVSRLANGVYYLNLKTDKTRVSKKIIKY